MKDINMNALSGILLQRVLSALGSTEIQIGNFGDVIAINKIFMPQIAIATCNSSQKSNDL